MAKLIKAPCPFCGGNDLSIIDIYVDDYVYDAVECDDCGMIVTPRGDTQRELWNAWNKRVVVSRNATTTPERTAKVTAIEGTPTNSCDCGRIVLSGWNYCPSCGCKLVW